MDFLNGLVGAGAAAATGGIFGLAGTIVGKVFNYFERKQEIAARQEEWAHELKLQELQMKAKVAETEQELAITEAAGSWEGLKNSIQADAALNAAGTYKWVNAVRALTRPTLTLGLTAILAFAYFSAPVASEMRSVIADAIIFAAVTSIVWWFGDRAPAWMTKHLTNGG